MKVAVLVLAVAVAAMGAWLGVLSGKVRELEKAQAELTAKAAQRVSSSSLELQGKCAEQARKQFADGGWTTKRLASFENHYNSDVNRCFIQITSLESDAALNRVVFDAFEGKEYGSFYRTGVGKGFGPQVLDCQVTLLSGEKKTCKSDDEFDELVKVYMEGGR